MQFDLFHVYTVDQHTLMVLRNLAAFASGRTDERFSIAHEVWPRLRKPELLAPDTYSLIHFREAERVVAGFAQLEAEARRIATTLPADMQDAYYQLVLHPVEACANLGRMYYAAGLNHLYAGQGNAAANDMAEEVRRTFARDSAITAYYHNRVAGGKWHHMMSQTHIGYTYWQQPEKNAMPEVQTLDLPDRAEMGINVEGSEAWWPFRQEGLSLPALDNLGDTFRYLDIFNRGTAPFAYRISADQPWITVDAANGEVDRQTRVRIGADWQRLSPGQYTGQLTVSGPDGQNARITVSARVFDKDDPDLQGRFVENNGYIAMEAAHFSRATTHNGIGWQVIPNLGRTLSSVTPVPVTAPVQTLTGEAPQLAYDLFFTSAGEVTVQVYLSPTLNFHNNQGLRFALSFDEQPPQVLNMHEGRTFQDWEESVRNNVTVVSAKLKIAGPGPHTLNFRMI
ncbi:MAG TPA: glycosyl hydrolase, partial [Calditrichia bacterium]|nr:glycosyl hydrolase [Calditrichia bacterium]